MNNENLNKLINQALAIEAEEAKKAGTLGYMARVLTQATLPHKETPGNEFTRTNGAFTLSILAPSKIGLPYGTIPRLVLAWLTTEAVKTKSPELILGHTLSRFMSEIGLLPTGGRWGTINRLKEQMQRLFSSSVSCHYEKAGEVSSALGLNIARDYCLWWNPKKPSQAALWQSTVTLSKDFFEEITSRPVPIDMRALNALKRSPLALDIYCWLTYRMSYLDKKTLLPWGALETQFGCDYGRTRDFKRKFLNHLRAVSVVYPEARIEDDELGLILKPSNTHIQKRPKVTQTLIVQSAENPKKPLDDKKDQKRYEAYKFNRVIETIERELPKAEKAKILREFESYLARKELNRLYLVKNNLAESNKATKEQLYTFITNYWHHLLTSIKSFDDFLEHEKINQLESR